MAQSPNTKFCLSISLLGVLFAGCTNGGAISGQTHDVEPVIAAKDVIVPAEGNRKSLALLGEDTYIRVGMDEESAFTGSFKKPEKGVSISQLPPSLDTNFRTKGWEYAGRSFAVISKDNKVVLGLETRDHTSKGDVVDFVNRATKTWGAPAATEIGEQVNYWFWEKDGVRLMMVVSDAPIGGLSFSQAIGVPAVMNVLRMDPASAKIDYPQAETSLKAHQSNPDSQQTVPANR